MHWAVLVDLARSPPAPLCSWVWRPLLLLLFAHGFGPSPPAPLCSWIWPPLLLLLFARGFGPSPPAPLCSWVWPLSSCSSLLVGLAPLLLFLFARGFGPSPPAPLHGLKTDSISLSPPSTSMSMWSPPMKQKAVNDGVFPWIWPPQWVLTNFNIS